MFLQVSAVRQALAEFAAGVAFASLALAGTVHAQDSAEDAVVPYRPTVSNPAQLSAPGQLELELGGLRALADASSRSSVPYTLKLAFTKDWGVLIGGDAHVWSSDSSGHADGIGDTSLTLKHAWLIDDATAFGIELGAKLPTAKPSLGSGRTDTTLNTIFSRDFGRLHMDLNLNATRLGAVDTGSSRTQIGAEAAFSTPISEHWSIIGEASGTRRSHTEHGDQLLAALTYSPSPRLTFDFGAARAPRPSPATTQWFAGAVFPIAKLW